MNVYPVTVNFNDEKRKFLLKLDVAHIRELCDGDKVEILDLLSDAPRKPALMGELLEAALRYKGNANDPRVTGDDLFDLMVEGGCRGIGDWTEVANQIAAVSGVLSDEQAVALTTQTKKMMDKSLGVLTGENDEADGGEERPTKTEGRKNPAPRTTG
ncbi:MAG: hypothetical protein LUG44_01100 [Clostridiales bacterium]|nr:hypothetical protein [Clostridiales bacterium]